MGLISQTIDSLKGGISQQPETLKLPEQGIEQVNGWSSELGGILKRPPIVFKKILGNVESLGSKPLVHMIDRDESEKYLVCLTGTGVKVFDLEGNSKEIRGDLSYLQTPNPIKDMKVLTIADYTFIVNTNKTIQEGTSKHLPNFDLQKEALVSIKGGQYGRTISLYINGVSVASVVLPDGSKPEHVKQLDAQTIAANLQKNINSNGQYGSIIGNGYIHITKKSTPIKSIRIDDGYNNQLASCIIHNVQSFNKLPLSAPHDYIVKISEDSNKGTDAYYVKFNANESVWEECTGWNVPLGYKKETMPHALVRESEGYFTLKQLDWGGRTCGDIKTNPDPSFIDSNINDIFLFRNRLGFLSGENVIMSRTGKYFDFYPASVASVSDDDPIDIAISSSRISILKYAVPFDNELILFSDNTQFSLASNTTLTANNIQLNLVSSYETTNAVRPTYLGKHIYFINKRSGYSSVYKYYSSYNDSNRKIADDVTSYVPTYIPSDIKKVSGSSTENLLTLLTEGKPNILYVYKYFYDDEQLKQQSWSHWDFGQGNKIISCDLLGSKMYILIETATKVYLTYIDFTKNTKDFINEELYRYHVDFKKVYQPTVYDNVNDETSFKLKDIYGTESIPFEYGEVFIISNNGVVFRFKPKGSKWTDDDILKIRGDLLNYKFIVGVSYTFKYKYSRFLIKQDDPNGSMRTTDTGRLQLRRAWVNYQDSGFFKVNVEANKRHYEYKMSGIELGYADTRIGELNVDSGQFRFPCQGKAEDVEVSLESDVPTPLHVIGTGWEALYTRRTTQI